MVSSVASRTRHLTAPNLSVGRPSTSDGFLPMERNISSQTRPIAAQRILHSMLLAVELERLSPSQANEATTGCNQRSNLCWAHEMQRAAAETHADATHTACVPVRSTHRRRSTTTRSAPQVIWYFHVAQSPVPGRRWQDEQKMVSICSIAVGSVSRASRTLGTLVDEAETWIRAGWTAHEP